MLTLEYLDGVQLADLDVEHWSLDQRRRLAYLITETWMTMIFRHGFFHGDPHPANILVLSPERIGLVDFGLTGKLTDDDMSKLTRLFIDAASENIELLPKRLADLGVRYPKEREEEFVAELRELYYRYYGASLREIDPIQVIREAFGLIYSMNLRLPTRFVMLDKAIATLGSVGVELYPDFNVFEVAKPYARDLMLERFTPRRVALRARREGWKLTQMAADLPYQIHDTLEQVRDGQIEVGFVHKGLDDFLAKLDMLFNRLVIAIVVTGGLIGSSLIGIFAKTGPHVLGLNVVSVARVRALGRARRSGCSGASSAPDGSRLSLAIAGRCSVVRFGRLRIDRRTIVRMDDWPQRGNRATVVSCHLPPPSCSPTPSPRPGAFSSVTSRATASSWSARMLRSTSCSPATSSSSIAGSSARR